MCEYQSVPHKVYAFRYQGTWGDFRLIVHQLQRLLPQSDLPRLIQFTPHDFEEGQIGDMAIGDGVIHQGDWLVIRYDCDPPQPTIMQDMRFRRAYRSAPGVAPGEDHAAMVVAGGTFQAARDYWRRIKWPGKLVWLPGPDHPFPELADGPQNTTPPPQPDAAPAPAPDAQHGAGDGPSDGEPDESFTVPVV